jgi:hypothetical protein
MQTPTLLNKLAMKSTPPIEKKQNLWAFISRNKEICLPSPVMEKKSK